MHQERRSFLNKWVFRGGLKHLTAHSISGEPQMVWTCQGLLYIRMQVNTHFLLMCWKQKKSVRIWTQDCELSSLLYTRDCGATRSSNSILKFADKTVVLGLISNNDETWKRRGNLTLWCQEKCLQLTVSKTKELVVLYTLQPQHDCSGEDEPLQIPERSRLWGSDVNWTRSSPVQKGKAASLLSETAKKLQISPVILRTSPLVL